MNLNQYIALIKKSILHKQFLFVTSDGIFDLYSFVFVLQVSQFCTEAVPAALHVPHVA